MRDPSLPAAVTASAPRPLARVETRPWRGRAGLVTVTAALVGTACALAARVGFRDRLLASDDLLAASVVYAFTGAAVLGVAAALALRGRVRGAVLACGGCLVTGAATLAFGVERAGADSLAAALMPGMVASAGFGLLATGVLLAARRRWPAWAGAAVIIAACALEAGFASGLPLWPRDPVTVPVAAPLAAPVPDTTAGGGVPLVQSTIFPNGVAGYVWADGTPWDGGTPRPSPCWLSTVGS
ncbi:hypothetical protein [Frankia nepalensis]|uniref:Uncharacterized protein n=1 Tax=Frankia nepalensis TaxID=1836974 RepID=A0A937RFC5_9ACTN|nr:hypothetical protein [Frankia nepalensis]MBL7499364.1 hypothetical protein [Frankia nepalensis]MBL7514122.1 hypothetical protein [Frankia nepalensis]MBL7626379.1 hypothetical protein [Frankia nepalensis]